LFGGLREVRVAPDIREIAVMYFADGWRIVAGRHRWGRYAFRVDAEEAALKLAARAQRHGRELAVLVQERHGEMRRLSVA
jgi:hypothetical protein